MISYAITVCNEALELDTLLNVLKNYLKLGDEVVILADLTKITEDVYAVLAHHKSIVRVHYGTFEKNFADWKNKLKELCTKDYIFFIDADEIPDYNLLTSLPQILEQSPEIDLILVPRVNIVVGLTQEHISKWGWRVDEKSRVNWPDYQTRICKNKPEIKWTGNVHERLSGYQVISMLPAEVLWSLYHIKNIDKQVRQNEYYNTI